MIRGIHHVALSTPDLDRMRHCYHDLRGFEIVAESRWPAGSEGIDRLSGFAGSAGRRSMRPTDWSGACRKITFTPISLDSSI
ncbi:MAG: glyoxalase/bleomycin resistance/dioxygenase family protein [Deltaproteobacteria bacterium]|nr:glyoxalase/bleomycin resistance/dioxygenase family protein [Deltaproteobacteria bacterium]